MPHTKHSPSGIPGAPYYQQATQPEKRSARALLTRRHPLTPREVAHVCNALLRIAEQITETDIHDIETKERPGNCMLHTLKESKNA